MRLVSTLGTTAVAALCALALAGTVIAAEPPAKQARVPGDRGHAMAARGSSEQRIVVGERWAATGGIPRQELPAPARADGVSFDWADAGLGAFAALGAVALLGVAVYAVRSRASGRPASGAAS